MNLKTSLETSLASNMQKRLIQLEEILQRSDQQISRAKDEITKQICDEGRTTITLRLVPIELSKYDVNFEVGDLLGSRLERSICSWLESEGLIVSAKWQTPHLVVKLYTDEYKKFSLGNASLSVKDIANKFEKNCNMEE